MPASKRSAIHASTSERDSGDRSARGRSQKHSSGEEQAHAGEGQKCFLLCRKARHQRAAMVPQAEVIERRSPSAGGIWAKRAKNRK